MARSTEDQQLVAKNHETVLLFMKPDVWYCFGDFEGCVSMPEDARHGSGRSIATLAGMGFVESVPVFEGFMTMKHRITSEGIAWLKNR